MSETRGPVGVLDVGENDPVVRHLLRSAVALHAEDLMRTVGALAQNQHDVREWCPLIERDVRDLCFLAAAAVDSGARLPAGLDNGEGDPEDPSSALEGLLASHEALSSLLTNVAERTTDPVLGRLIVDILDRREEEADVLRGLGAGHGLPQSERLVHGALPKFQA